MKRDQYRREEASLEIAKVLAAGIIRLKLRGLLSTDASEVDIREHSSDSRLDVSNKSMLSVSRPVNRCLTTRTRR